MGVVRLVGLVGLVRLMGVVGVVRNTEGAAIANGPGSIHCFFICRRNAKTARAVMAIP